MLLALFSKINLKCLLVLVSRPEAEGKKSGKAVFSNSAAIDVHFTLKQFVPLVAVIVRFPTEQKIIHVCLSSWGTLFSQFFLAAYLAVKQKSVLTSSCQ